jgi:hypothetical protein
MFGLILLLVLILLLIVIFFFRVSKEDALGWRFRSVGEDQIVYSEVIDGAWESISFQLIRYSKDAPRHVIEVPQDWNEFPLWAQHHQEIIMNRMRKQFQYPQYSLRYTK